MPKPDDRLATVSEVAEALNVTESALAQQRYRHQGLPFVRVGRSVRYRWSDVEAYLQAQTVKPSA